MSPRPYSLLVGQGRSGTNWLLELFQASPRSFCRNEPYALAGSPFQALQRHQNVVRADRDDLDGGWDQAVAYTLLRQGNRDPRLDFAKDYFHGFGNGIGRRIVGKTKVRKALGLLAPELRKEEWTCPGWLVRRAEQAKAPAVIKLLQAPGWTTFVVEHRPEVPVFQIIRHPGGFLNSWANRYLAASDADAVLAANRARLADVASAAPAWGERFGAPEELGLEASELWYWRYANECSYDLAQGRTNFRAIPFEGLAVDPLPIMQDAYALAGLPWSETVAARITAACAHSASIAKDWKSRLHPHQVAIVEEIMQDSSMRRLWEDL